MITCLSWINYFVFLLQLIGLGPHSSKKKQDLDKLYELKSKARQIMNQFGPSALINLSNFSSIKPEPASTPPQGSMANSTAVVKIPGTPGTGGRLSPENNQVSSSFCYLWALLIFFFYLRCPYQMLPLPLFLSSLSYIMYIYQFLLCRIYVYTYICVYVYIYIYIHALIQYLAYDVFIYLYINKCCIIVKQNKIGK